MKLLFSLLALNAALFFGKAAAHTQCYALWFMKDADYILVQENPSPYPPEYTLDNELYCHVSIKAFKESDRKSHEGDSIFFERIIKESNVNNVNPGYTCFIIRPYDLPPMTFRTAWEICGRKVVVNMDKARRIHLGHLRAMRDIELQKMDVAYNIAVDAGAAPEELRKISEARIKLRNLPETFDLSAFKTPEELRWAMPDILNPMFENLNSISDVINNELENLGQKPVYQNQSYWDIVPNGGKDPFVFKITLRDEKLDQLSNAVFERYSSSYDPHYTCGNDSYF